MCDFGIIEGMVHNAEANEEMEDESNETRALTLQKAAWALLGVSTLESMAPTLTNTLGFDIIASSLFASAFSVARSMIPGPDSYSYIAIQERFMHHACYC